MSNLLANAFLLGMLGILCMTGNRMAKKQDRKIAEFYAKQLESVRNDVAVEQDMLFAVLDRVVKFGQEVDEEFQRLEDRLRVHEESSALVAMELEQLRRPRVA